MWPYGGRSPALRCHGAHASHCISIFCEVIASTKRLSSHSKAAGPRNQRLCLVPHTCRFLGQQSSGCRTDNEGLKSSRVAPTLPVTRRGRPVRPSKNSGREKVFSRRIRPSRVQLLGVQQRCAFWVTLTSYLGTWRVRWIDPTGPLGGRYSGLDVDDGCTRQVEADF